jgi:hypothetical protein
LSWNKELERGLPDCRLTVGRNKTVVHKTRHVRAIWERVFCANCGCDGGLVMEDWAAHIFYLCAECAVKHGGLSIPEIPEAVVRGE